MKQTVVYDLETIRNFFLYMDINYKTGEEKIFRIGDYHNELPELVSYLTSGSLSQVGFNNLKFDSQIQQYIINNSSYWIKHDYTGTEINNEIYKYTQSVINKQDTNAWSDYPAWKLSIPQLDLMSMWHFNNRAKLTGLKWLQFSMDWPTLQDMPINHNDIITEEQCDEVVKYCRNDILSTKQFFYITLGRTELPLYKGKDKLQLRKNIKDKFNIDCLNYNDVKIGDELNKQSYLKITQTDKAELKNLRAIINDFTFGDCIPDYVKFITPELQEFYNKVKKLTLDLNQKQNQPLTFRGTKYIIAKGGIHSEDKPRLLKPNNNQLLLDADIGSQYPNSIRKRRLYPRHLGPEWLQMYSANIDFRLDAKKQFKITKDPSFKTIDELYKLALNGAYGKLGESTSWQYDPFIVMQVTIGNQFEILMLIEMLEESGIHVVSANTDGIVCLFDKSNRPVYDSICKKWEVIVGNDVQGQLEYTQYDFLAQASVNDYLALKSNNPDHPESLDDRIKTKGDFLIDFDLHKNKSNNIVTKALMNYFVHNKDPKQFIKEHRNIYDFCSCVRAKGQWHLEAESIIDGEYNKEILQKTVRYYISNGGVKMVKNHEDGRKIQVEAGKWMQTVFNNFEEKKWDDYDINYNYYITKVYDIINSIKPEVTMRSTQLTMSFAA